MTELNKDFLDLQTNKLSFEQIGVKDFIRVVAEFVTKEIKTFYLLSKESNKTHKEFVISKSYNFVCELPYGEYMRYKIENGQKWAKGSRQSL